MDWIQVAPYRVDWWVLVNTNDVLSDVQGWKSVINWWSVSFLRSTLLCGLKYEPFALYTGSYICEKWSWGKKQGLSLNWKLPVVIAVSNCHAALKSSWHTIINTINISFRFLLYPGAKGWVMLSICPKSNTCTARSNCLIGCAWHWAVGFLKSCSLEG
jgi:hypothetical protein